MLKIRKASEEDQEAVRLIQEELELDYVGSNGPGFWVAEEEGKVVGIARLEEFEGFFFLNAVGVTGNKQNRRVASRLLRGILKDLGKDIYLYTIIPGFFIRFGFEEAAPIPGLPPRTKFGCERCLPKQCVCMRKPARTD